MLPNFTIDNSNKLKVNVEVNQEYNIQSYLRVVILEAIILSKRNLRTQKKNFFFVARYMLPDATGSKFGIEGWK